MALQSDDGQLHRGAAAHPYFCNMQNSRYSIVLATSKRARQIIAGAEPQVHYSLNKPLSIAVKEVYEGKVKIIPDTTSEEEEQEPAATEL